MSSVVDKQEIINMISCKSPRLELVSFEAGKSEAWRWFKRVRVDGLVLPYAVCNGCFKPVHYTPRDGTGGLRRHSCALTIAMSQESRNNSHHSSASQTKLSAAAAAASSAAAEAKIDCRTFQPAATTVTSSSLPQATDITVRQRSSMSGNNLASGGGGGGSPVNKSRSRRSAVPISLTLWAAEKGLVDLKPAGSAGGGGGAGSAAAAAAAAAGGMAIANAFAALQGILPGGAGARGSPFAYLNYPLLAAAAAAGGGGGGGASGASVHSVAAAGHNKIAELALDLAIKKKADFVMDEERIPLQIVDNDKCHLQDRHHSIVDHILKNIGQSSHKLVMGADNDQNNRFINSSPIARSAGRRPRKRANPDRAIPTSSSTATLSGSADDVEANLQMLAQVANEPAIKRERLSPQPADCSVALLQHNVIKRERLSPQPMDCSVTEQMQRRQASCVAYKLNGGEMTPNSQRSVPSPEASDDLLCSGSSSGGNKSGLSSPAQFVPVSCAIAASCSDSCNAPTPPSSALMVHESVDHLRDTSQLKHIETFVSSLQQVLSDKLNPDATLADASQLIQLSDVHMCLDSLLRVHKKYLTLLESKMPVPELQKQAPAFKGIAVVDGQFKDISLDDFKGKYVILFFYPLDFTFVCPTEIIAFSERADEFRKINCEIVACSTDSHFCHLAWVNTPRKQGGLGSLNIPLLADKSAAISKTYGVYKEDEGLTFRGLFIIDDQQRLRQITINDLPVGRSVDETLRLVQAFQFTDKHGEVCPAGWTPGKKTMKADPAGSKEYFEDVQ